MTKRIDRETKNWIRNASDERAAANGCRFDPERGQFVVDWCAKYLRLYEGEHAGEPFTMTDWQLEATMRLFGWIKYSERWSRHVRRFKRAGIWVPKKNKKSPTLAAWGLYLLCADGEMGQKVFFGAKDGSQARENCGRHCVEMVSASEELLEECSINKSLMRITHEPTRSILQPISSGDSKTQKSKEGINGCVLIDETHVVDRSFMARVSRAGISRSEPLQIEVSTAGDDPESYGKTQYDWGKRVESGEQLDEQFFFLCYEAPQDLTDMDLAADPEKFGVLANPSWNHTVDPLEFREDYTRSTASLSDLSEFKMYRLNVWLTASNPAIRIEDWIACEEKFDERELIGKECYGGLDLSLKWDTTALVLWFPWGKVDGVETYRMLSKFWLPEETANRQRQKIRWHDWAAKGHITLTDGDITDFPLVHAEIVKAAKTYKLVELAYDERFAEAFCQRLQDEERIPVSPFTQSAPNFNEPCETFESLIIDGRLRHSGNRVMDWQISQLTFKQGGLKMPMKPKNNPLARIDGPVAAIMGLDSAILDGGSVSIYSTPGSLAL